VPIPGYEFHTEYEGTTAFIHATYMEADTVSGAIEEQRTREWVIDMLKASRSQVVATCFKCVITSMEHKTREWFLYRDKAIYQPHHDVDALLAICEARS
jgi:hypothetical protein